jgi:hypothetical protein
MKPFIVLFVVFGFAGGVAAQERDVDPDSVKTGKIVVKMSSDFAKPYIDGVVYEQHEFEADGKTLLLLEVSRDKAHTIRLEPIYPELGPTEFTVQPKDWKLVRVERLVKEWQFKKTVRFGKPKPKTVPKPDADKGPEEKKPSPAAKEKAGENFLMGK